MLGSELAKFGQLLSSSSNDGAMYDFVGLQLLMISRTWGAASTVV